MRTGRLLGGVVIAGALAAAAGCGQSSTTTFGPKVTLTGCLQPGDSPNTFRLAAIGGPNGAVGTTGENNQTSQKDNPTGTPSRSNSSDIGAATTRLYTLVPGREIDLGVHQGTVVQVTGRLDQNQAPVSTSGSGSNNSNASTQPVNGKSGQATSGQSGASGGNTNAGNTRSAQQGTGGQGSIDPTTGTGPDAGTHGATADRGAATVHVEAVKRVAGHCGDTR